MTIKHAQQVLDAQGFENPTQKAVLLEIAYRCDKNGTLRYTQEEIAGLLGCTRGVVADWFAAFERVAIIERIGHGRYRLLDDAFIPEENGEWDITSLLNKANRVKRKHP